MLRAPSTVNKGKLLELLGRRRGVAGRIRARDLAVLLGLPTAGSERTLRLAIRELVEEGYPIGALTNEAQAGFFWVATPQELEQVLANYRSRAREIEKRMVALVDAYRQGPKQVGLFRS